MAALPLRVGLRNGEGLGVGRAAAGWGLAGRPGRLTGAGSRWALLGARRSAVGGAGPVRCARGPAEAFGKCLPAVGRNSALGTRRLACALLAKVADFTTKLGEARQDRTEGVGTGRTRLDGDQIMNKSAGSTGARCVDVAMPVFGVCCLWLF